MILPVLGCHLELQPDRERLCVIIRGELDLASVEPVRRELNALRLDGWREISVDLSELDFMDVSGVRLLLGAFEESDRAGALFAIVGASAPVCRILELTGCAHLLTPRAANTGEHVRWAYVA
ncbi:MAG TPA: STAS domain-containing protein [Solirubrobacteraceae bacterium]|nr:STAS domain-containing protein [Solirubrobacteraceae bacterium]